MNKVTPFVYEFPPAIVGTMENSNQVKCQVRAQRVLAGGVSSQFRATDPIVFSHGRGSRIWDVDGNEYIDFTLSQGPLIHGHSHPSIIAAVTEALTRGQVWNGLHEPEIELAEKLVEIIPCADLVRLGCTGSETVQAALRLARAFTGRSKVLKFEGHYHGWLDSVAASINPPVDGPESGTAPKPAAVRWSSGMARHALDDLIVAPWNDGDALEAILREHSGELAAIITEPCMCNSGCVEPATGYLARLRELCDRHRIVLIFDEVITGFRLALAGAQQYYGVVPDLAIFGKAVASGFPLSVLAGRREIMGILDGRTIHAGTLNAQTGCVAAALASVQLLESDRATYDRLHAVGNELKAGLESAARAAGCVAITMGPGSVFHMGFPHAARGADRSPIRNYRDVASTYDMAKYGRFVRHMAGRGVRLIGRGIWYVSTAHSAKDIQQTLDAARSALQALASEQ
jgi:glutamate-1-semialdehyde 2,1-aminomutase